MATKNEARVSISASEAAELLAAYDSWSGGLHPDDREEYLARFNRLRGRIRRLRMLKPEEFNGA